MMAGFIFVTDISSFWIIFVLSEIAGYLSNQKMEGLLMVIKVIREAKLFAKKLTGSAITFQDTCLPYRLSLLMIWCNSSEKG